MEESLKRIYGIGDVLCEKLLNQLSEKYNINKKYKDADIKKLLKESDLFESLPKVSKMDIIISPDKRIPHVIIQSLDKELHKILTKFKFNIAGSYRRKKPFSRDVDIVLSIGKYSSSVNLWKKVYSLINKSKNLKIMKPYSAGDKKIASVIFFKNYKLKTDLFITNSNEYHAMLLYATGSGEFNMRMRASAKRKGMLLNQHGIFKNNKKIITNTEKDIFEKIGWKYLNPENR